jgi:lysophospholipase L1-like esterase
MVRDWGDTLQVSRQSMSTRYTHVFDDEAPVDYDFATRRPDIVIINLGTNDYSPGNIPDVAQYVGAYTKMIATLTRHYGEVPILCITPHSANAYLRAAIGELGRAVAAMSMYTWRSPCRHRGLRPRLGSDCTPTTRARSRLP